MTETITTDSKGSLASTFAHGAGRFLVGALKLSVKFLIFLAGISIFALRSYMRSTLSH